MYIGNSCSLLCTVVFRMCFMWILSSYSVGRYVVHRDIYMYIYICIYIYVYMYIYICIYIYIKHWKRPSSLYDITQAHSMFRRTPHHTITQHHDQDLLNPGSLPRSFADVSTGREIWSQNDTEELMWNYYSGRCSQISERVMFFKIYKFRFSFCW